MPLKTSLGALCLVALLAFIAPTLTFLTLIAHFARPHLHITQHIERTRKWRMISSTTFRPRKVLITGVGTPAGLSLARTFYRAGHTVIGADTNQYLSGRLSNSLEIFYTVKTGYRAYERDIVDICRKEKIELWVPCGANTVTDALVKSTVQNATKCRVVGLDSRVQETLEGQGFLEIAKAAGLNTPDTRLVVSEDDAIRALYSDIPQDGSAMFSLIPVGSSISSTESKVLLPFSARSNTETYISKQGLSSSSPSLLQQHIHGEAYLVHVMAIQGVLKAFAAIPATSSEASDVTFQALPATSHLFTAFLSATQRYVHSLGKDFTGHLTIDFLLSASAPATLHSAEDLGPYIFVTAGTSKLSVAALSLEDKSEDLSEAYISILPNHEPKGVTTGHYNNREVVVPKKYSPVYYSVWAEVMRLVVLPSLGLMTLRVSLSELARKWIVCGDLLWKGKEMMWEVWDPWPSWWTFCVRKPWVLLECAIKGVDWRTL